jgi:hypothetical protein
MRKLPFILTAAAACAATLSLSGSAQAGTIAGAEGVRAALADLSAIEKVHCTPGRVHRRTPPHDGCYRSVYRAPVYPSYGYGYGPYAYGYPYAYRPGLSVGIGFGRPWGGYWGPGYGIGFGF